MIRTCPHGQPILSNRRDAKFSNRCPKCRIAKKERRDSRECRGSLGGLGIQRRRFEFCPKCRDHLHEHHRGRKCREIVEPTETGRDYLCRCIILSGRIKPPQRYENGPEPGEETHDE